MNWERIRLGDCCSKIGSGATPKGGSTVYVDAGVSFIRSQNVYNLHFDYSGLTHITEDAAKKLNGVTIYEGDVLLNITGDSVARTCIVPADVLPARVNQHVAIVRPNAEMLNSRFLNYYLASPYMQAFMLGLAVGKGASRNAMTKDMIANYEVPCPPLDTQKRIADILSAYDNLIENNQKQIKLLEEGAQRLYKEWFVDLHFPGCEDAVIVDGVPEEWVVKKISEIAILKAGGDKPKDFSINKTNKYSIPVFANGITKKGLMGYTEKAIITDPSVTISARGTVGVVFLRKEPFMPIVRLVSVTPNDSEDVLYLYLYLQNQSFRATGAAQQQITIPLLNSKEVIYPSEHVRKAFYRIVEPIFNKIDNMEKQIGLFEQARDRLLPKLMSGEIEV